MKLGPSTSNVQPKLERASKRSSKSRSGRACGADGRWAGRRVLSHNHYLLCISSVHYSYTCLSLVGVGVVLLANSPCMLFSVRSADERSG